MLLVLLENLTSNVLQGLYAKIHMEIWVYAGTPIYIYTWQTWDTTHKNISSSYTRVSNAPEFEEELYNDSKGESRQSYLCKLTNKQKLSL